MALTVGTPQNFLTNGRLTSAIYRDKTGVVRFAPSGALRLDHDLVTKAPLGVLIEPASTNLLTMNNVNPTSLAGLEMSTPGVVTLVDDAAELALIGLEAICSSGKVFKIDNSLGTNRHFARWNGVSAGTWGISAYIRGGSGRLSFNLNSGSDRGGVDFGASAHYRRVSFVNALGGQKMTVWADPGQVVYFILQQVEATRVTSVIPNATGAALTRAADVLSLPPESPRFEDLTAFTISIDATPQALDSVLLSLSDLSGDNRIDLWLGADGAVWLISVVGGLEDSTMIGAAGVTAGSRIRAAFAWSDGDVELVVNAEEPVIEPMPLPPGFAKLWLGRRPDGSKAMPGHIGRVLYLPRNMNTAELQDQTNG